MLDWIGSLSVREHKTARAVLGLSPSTRIAGLALSVVGAYGVWTLWDVSVILSAFPAAALALGIVLATLDRQVVVDRSAGTLVLKQGVLGLGTSNAIPLFHLRAVVVMAKPGMMGEGGKSRYVAYLDRRVGDTIYLDEGKRCARLLRMAEAIAEVAELRLEYDAGAA